MIKNLGSEGDIDVKTKSMLIGIFLASAFTLSFAHQLLAAPFCTVFSYGVQCRYYTYAQCKGAAGTDGYCVVNAAEIHQNVVAPFCVVLPYGNAKQCQYQDTKACNDAATAAGGVCLSTRKVATATGQEKNPAAVGNEGQTEQGYIPTSPVGNMGTPAPPPPMPGVTLPLFR
ncbi:MAG TPA: hypothetical protein VJ550_04100 [Geomonas sp.]|nr:hypothetical protein [Geomonas sp.]